MADGLAELRAKLRAREGRSGYAANVVELHKLIEEATAEGAVYRKARTGHFVSKAYYEANRETTYRQKVGP
jgi:hypothetical protein